MLVLDIIHHPVLYIKHKVVEAGFCVRLQVKLFSWAQLIELVLLEDEDRIQSPKHCVFK
jgi:hypothetical protein